MKNTPPNRNRVRRGFMASDDTIGMNGRFIFERAYKSGTKTILQVIVSDGALTEWEHVSICIPDRKRCPTWEEMCYIKDLFWDAHETVLQFHPKETDYINQHPFVLHLWRKVGEDFELPPINLV